jgi:hypothetical protein
MAGNDPALGAKFVDSFLELRRPLPESIHESEILRAYAYRRFGNPDPNVAAAFALEKESDKRRRILIRCLLLRPEYSYDTIGKKMGCSVDSVRLYEKLFWPVRDQDELFIASLVFPQTRRCELEEGYAQNETEENLAYRAALRYGMEAVEVLLGFKKNMIMNETTQQMAETLMRDILANAKYLSHLGLLNQDSPGWKKTLAVLRLVNSGRARSQEDLPAWQVGGMSTAAAVSQSLGKGREVVHHWPIAPTVIPTGEKVSTERDKITPFPIDSAKQQAQAEPLKATA